MKVPVTVEVVISTPSITPIGDKTINDNGGAIDSSVAVVS